MSLSKDEIKSIKWYKGKKYNLDLRTADYSLRDIIKYVMYWKYLIDNYKGEIRSGGTSIGVVSYAQLTHMSREDLDDKSPKSILKLQSYMFMKDNDFSDDQRVLVDSYIEKYYSFMNFLEYKNPIYLSVALLCIDTKIEVVPEKEDEPPLYLQEETGFYGDAGDEFRYEDEGGSDYGGDEGSDFGGDFGDDFV